MKNYLKPYTKCTKVESEGYLLAGSPGGGHETIKVKEGNKVIDQGQETKGASLPNSLFNSSEHSEYSTKELISN